MAKTQHTHDGTCQCCGRHQAVDNVTQKIAKHGYTVDFGFFHGVCPGGQGIKPAEFDVTYTHTTINNCWHEAVRHEQTAKDLRAGKTKPLRFERWNKDKLVTKRGRGGYDELDIALATADELKRTTEACIHQHEHNAAGLRGHIKFLTESVLPRLGKELFVAEVKRDYSKGMHLVHNGTEIELTRPYMSVFGNKRLGWYAKDVKGNANGHEFRYTTRELNKSKVKP